MSERKLLASLACGCKVEVDAEDVIHATPCSLAHEGEMTRAARRSAERLGVPLEETWDDDIPSSDPLRALANLAGGHHEKADLRCARCGSTDYFPDAPGSLTCDRCGARLP